jgi:hypothetical protein
MDAEPSNEANVDAVNLRGRSRAASKNLVIIRALNPETRSHRRSGERQMKGQNATAQGGTRFGSFS